jgi:hypothetical protein
MNKVKNENSKRWDKHTPNSYPTTCTQHIFNNTAHYCPISFAQKCGLVLYMIAKAKHPCITLFVIKAINLRTLEILHFFIEKPMKVVHYTKKNIELSNAPTTNECVLV